MKKNKENIEYALQHCPFRFAMSVLEGKWKFAILYNLTKHEVLRFKELERSVAGITPRMLIKELKDLEQSGIVRRKPYATVPPTVEYSLTEHGKTIYPVIQSIQSWGSVHIEHQKIPLETYII
ncbi:MAG: hypothetical protein RLZZ292_2447 [Bacteroidota bacterium]|jgi:DNA-binding HxlR family transcriptional regulator